MDREHIHRAIHRAINVAAVGGWGAAATQGVVWSCIQRGYYLGYDVADAYEGATWTRTRRGRGSSVVMWGAGSQFGDPRVLAVLGEGPGWMREAWQEGA